MNQKSISWGELAELTHAKQVEAFNWCACEEQEQFPYDDCPRFATCAYCLNNFDTAEMCWFRGWACVPCYHNAVKQELEKAGE